MNESLLDNLERRNNLLKYKLLHEKLMLGIYPSNNHRREMSQFLNEYSRHKSIFKAASKIGISNNLALKWYIRGQMGDPNFKLFYLRIKQINEGFDFDAEEIKPKYNITQFGNGWIYVTFVDGEKISIISSDLDHLKNKVKDKNLPL